ncbi:MAG: antitoxin VapB family protein [Nanoarchaeota archaeon]|nr:antitoxin VapB family protein [Nanoarchaeota archaeon]
MISSIQLREAVKVQLARYKERDNESFEEVIVRLIKKVESQRRDQKKLLIEGYKEMAEESLKIQKEWEATDNTLDWEW